MTIIDLGQYADCFLSMVAEHCHYQRHQVLKKCIINLTGHIEKIFLSYLCILNFKTHFGFVRAGINDKWFQKLSLKEMLVIKLNNCETLNLSNYVYEKTKKLR